MGNSGSAVSQSKFYESVPAGYKGICYDYAINAAIIYQNQKRGVDNHLDLISFTPYPQGADKNLYLTQFVGWDSLMPVILSSKYSVIDNPNVSFDGFIKQFEPGDVMIWKKSTLSHFAVYVEDGRFAGVNNGCISPTLPGVGLFQVPEPTKHVLYRLPNERVIEFAGRFKTHIPLLNK